MNERPTPPLTTGWRRVLYVCLGLVFVGFAYLGVILPGVPATPFLLVASFFFVRSSPRLHRWLQRAPIFGRLLHDWEVHRGIRRPVKIVAVCLVVTAVTLSIIFSGLPVWAKCVIAGLALVGIATILLVPTARPPV